MPVSDRYRRPDDLPSQLSVFPLRGVLMLPGTTMPLHVFEPRYLELLEAVISGDRVLGIVQPERTEEPVESPQGKSVALRNVGCAGRVTAFQELDDGRLFVTLTGVARFTLGDEIKGEAPYRTFAVRYTDFPMDFEADNTGEQVDRAALFDALKSYLATSGLSVEWNAITNAPTEQVVNVLSVVAPFGPEEKQALLEAASLKSRAEILVALAKMAAASGNGGGGSTMQ